MARIHGRPAVELDTSAVRRLLAEAQSRYDELDNARAVDEERALTIALSLEESFEQAYADALEQAEDPVLRELFADLLRRDRGHDALLERGRRIIEHQWTAHKSKG